MENIINITSVNMYSFVKEIVYGTNYVSTESEFIFNKFKGILDTYEQACNIHLFRTNGDMQIDPEGVFSVNVIFVQRDFTFPDLHPDNFLITEFIKEARESKSIVCGNIDDSLIKKASRLAKLSGIGFHLLDGGLFEFNGSEKTKAVSAQIVDAYLNGDTSISFNLDKNAPGTLRCYASNIGGAYGKKFKCTSEDRVMTIWFKEMDAVDRLRLEIKNIENRFIDLVTPNEFQTVFAERIYELTGHKFIPLLPKKGYADFAAKTLNALSNRFNVMPEDLLKEIDEDVTMDVEWDEDHDRPLDNTETILDPAAHFGSGDYEDNEPQERDYEAEANETPTHLVDGMNQTYISELYEKTPQDEDDDF